MLKIATHDSATGESGKWFCWPLNIFAKTQSKTLLEQYNAGCRVFDIRIKLYKGQWHCAHGLWISKKNTYDILFDLWANVSIAEPVYISITFEGKNPDRERLKTYYEFLKSCFQSFKFMYLAIKYGDESDGLKVKYTYLETSHCDIQCEQAFKQLDGRSWHTYIPIPWLWKKIYYNTPIFNDNKYKYVDFL